MTPHAQVVHFVARCRPGRYPFFEPVQARWLWVRLRANFPDALAAAIMPNHVHLVIAVVDADAVQHSLAALLASFSRRFGLGETWEPVPPPHPLATTDKILRQVRYVHLNPCRPCRVRGQAITLTDDPLRWAWTTHRDVVGAVADPWVTPSRLASALECERHDFADWFHAYVSGDPSVRVEGTPPPRAAQPATVPRVNLADIARAAAASVHSTPVNVRIAGSARRVFLWLAQHQGWTHTPLLADATGADPTTVRRVLRVPRQAALQAAALCLGDARLCGPEAFGRLARKA